MNYKIFGESLPVVEISLENGESVKCQAGAMSYMTANLKMDTKLGKGVFSRMFTGESMFLNTYTAQDGDGMIGFASSFPGSIRAFELSGGKQIICQKQAYLASYGDVDFSIYLQKKLGAGFFGGEGFIMEKIGGNGTVFVEIDGSAIEKTLDIGEKLIIDTGYLAVCDSTCSIDIKGTGSFKNALFGGEGIFNTVITGPGNVIIQSIPKSKLIGAIGANTSSSSSD